MAFAPCRTASLPGLSARLGCEARAPAPPPGLSRRNPLLVLISAGGQACTPHHPPLTGCRIEKAAVRAAPSVRTASIRNQHRRRSAYALRSSWTAGDLSSFGVPAAAIMAALSVVRLGGG